MFNARGGNRNLFIVFIMAVFTITVFAVIGENGLIDAWRLRKEKNNIAGKIAELQEENKKLSEEIKLLKSDREYIARVAKKELGMVGKNEVIYIEKD